LDYAMIAVVSNPAAGRSDTDISIDEIMGKLQLGMVQTRLLLEAVIPAL
jgi:purine nucleoside phosphorylase